LTKLQSSIKIDLTPKKYRAPVLNRPTLKEVIRLLAKNKSLEAQGIPRESTSSQGMLKKVRSLIT